MPLIVLEFIRQFALVAQASIVKPLDTTEPVAMFQLSVALDVILTPHEVPHEIAPVHEVALIADKELQILPCGRNRDGLAGMEDTGHLAPRDATHPSRIEAGMLGRIHTREEYVLLIFHLAVVARHIVRILLIRITLFRAIVDGRAIGKFRSGITVGIHLAHLILRGISLAIEQRTVAILVTAQIASQGEDVLWRVLVHRRIRSRADDNNRIAGVADHEHKHTEERGVLHT